MAAASYQCKRFLYYSCSWHRQSYEIFIKFWCWIPPLMRKILFVQISSFGWSCWWDSSLACKSWSLWLCWKTTISMLHTLCAAMAQREEHFWVYVNGYWGAQVSACQSCSEINLASTINKCLSSQSWSRHTCDSSEAHPHGNVQIWGHQAYQCWPSLVPATGAGRSWRLHTIESCALKITNSSTTVMVESHLI
jgi:hypothetical protein